MDFLRFFSGSCVLVALELPALDVPNTWVTFGIALALLIGAIWAIVRLNASSSEGIDRAEIDRQMLTAVSELRSQGELSQEEFRSIKSRLVDQIKDAELKKKVPESSDDLSEDKTVADSSISNIDEETEATKQDLED